MKSPTASNWTSPKSNLRTPRRSNKGENWEQTNRARNQDVYDYWEVRYYWVVE
jgi:hypothetical protein